MHEKFPIFPDRAQLRETISEKCIHINEPGERTMSNTFLEQDSVEWRYADRSSRGRIMEKLTAPAEIEGHRVMASPDDPYYVVQDYETGKLSAHRPDVLRRI